MKTDEAKILTWCDHIYEAYEQSENYIQGFMFIFFHFNGKFCLDISALTFLPPK